MIKKFVIDSFTLESGTSLSNIEIAYQTFGERNADDSNIIWVFHSVSANADVLDWWEGLFGPGKLYDSNEYFVICANAIGSPYGSTAPTGLDFPQFTVRDLAETYCLLASDLNIEQVHTAIGGSFGGSQALEFVYSFSGEIDHLILLASTSRESAWGIAVHESQRLALFSDPTFGSSDGGDAGMKAARSMAMLTYRTPNAFIEKQTDEDDKVDHFKAASYMQYQGDKFIKRFNALSYYYLTKCLDTHNVGRGRGGEVQALSSLSIPTLIIGITSDKLVPPRFQRFMATHIPHAVYQEIDSEFGHDGFLVETKKIDNAIRSFYANLKDINALSSRVVMKFGGTSLAQEKDLKRIASIIQEEAKTKSLALVVSARGKSTDLLLDMFELAYKGEDYKEALSKFIAIQENVSVTVDISEEVDELKNILNAIQLLRANDEFAKDRVLSFGELISAKIMTAYLNAHGLKAVMFDARQIIYTQLLMGEFRVNYDKSRLATIERFESLASDEIPVITGFIASSEEDRTVTLGRNGSNYTATLVASFIGASEVVNWTDVSSIYSSNPAVVQNAVPIKEMSYREANELANFGTNVLHPKTIQPLIDADIPLRIRSINALDNLGTVITRDGGAKGIKAVSSLEQVALVSIEGQGMLDKIGIDSRIFSILSQEGVSVRMIAQASSERGIGFVINESDADKAELALIQEFAAELKLGHIGSIRINKDISIIAIIGRHNYSLEKAIHVLRENKIWMHLISNSISGELISLVVDEQHTDKALKLVHNEVFGVKK